MARPFRKRGLVAATSMLMLLTGAACSDDGGAPPGGAAGTAAGSGGSGGSSGSGGSATGGSAGDAGSAGTGGGAGIMDAGGATISPAERAVLATLTPLPAVPADTTNRVADNPAAAALGQKLFFDPAFSGPLKVASDLGAVGEAGKVSCASCHSSSYLDDARSVPETVSLGTDFHTRNSPTLVNASFYAWTNWGGRFSAQWELPMVVLENGVIMNGNRLQLVHRIFDAYRTDYELVFGAMDAGISDLGRFPANGKPKPAPTPAAPAPPDGPWEAMTPADRLVANTVLVNYSKAIGAFLRLLVSRNSAFDRWMAGDEAALDIAAQRGARVFIGSGRCITCHLGPHFSDDQFHNIGVPQTGEKVPAADDGRFKDVPGLLASPFNSKGSFSDDPNSNRLLGLTDPMPESSKSAFRTPDLRGVVLTAPYMHKSPRLRKWSNSTIAAAMRRPPASRIH
jgi:cytochrome c peroxidase